MFSIIYYVETTLKVMSVTPVVTKNNFHATCHGIHYLSEWNVSHVVILNGRYENINHQTCSVINRSKL